MPSAISYVVINRTTSDRFTDIVVNGAPSTPDSIVVTGNTVSWPNDGWYQVQDAVTFESVCEGGLSCSVDNGTYIVINHTTGERFSGIAIDNEPVNADNTRVQVEFTITVPAYQSDTLQVRLTWGDTPVTADWVGGEFWSASLDLPTNSERTLNVTFYDLNGDIELARASQQYRTGANAAETFAVGVEQFDASLFDVDEDGIANLDELIAGTDPTAIEGSQLEILEFYALSDFFTSRMSVSRSFESQLTDERPYFESNERFPVPGGYPGRQSSVVDIDAAGNGIRTYYETLQGSITDLMGTRTNTGTAIIWEGSRYTYDGHDIGHNVNFTNTVTMVDETTRSFVEEIVGSSGGTYQFGWNISSNLTGRLIEGTSFCAPVAGTVSETYHENYSEYPTVRTTVTTVIKETDEPYWRVEVVSSDDEITEYFARELIIFRPTGTASTELTPEYRYFICDSVDF